MQFSYVVEHKSRFYHIDIVVHLNGRQYALECDGHHYHRTENRLRDAVLEKRGFEVYHISDIDFDAAEDKVKLIKDTLNIQ